MGNRTNPLSKRSLQKERTRLQSEIFKGRENGEDTSSLVAQLSEIENSISEKNAFAAAKAQRKIEEEAEVVEADEDEEIVEADAEPDEEIVEADAEPDDEIVEADEDEEIVEADAEHEDDIMAALKKKAAQIELEKAPVSGKTEDKAYTPPKGGDDFFEAEDDFEHEEPEITDESETIGDGSFEFLLDAEMIAGLATSGLDFVLGNLLPSIYKNNHFSEEEQKILAVISYKTAQNKGKLNATLLDKEEFFVLDKYNLFIEYEKSLPLSEKEAAELKKVTKILVKKYKLMVSPEKGLFYMLLIIFAKRAYPAFSPKIAKVSDAFFDKFMAKINKDG